jgi:aminobenzoyl-glutamate utilization protein B
VGRRGAGLRAGLPARAGPDRGGLTDADLRAAARADLDRRRGDYRYVLPLPPEQRHPIELPDWLVSDGSAEAMGDLARLA